MPAQSPGRTAKLGRCAFFVFEWLLWTGSWSKIGRVGSGERGAEPADQADCCSFDAGTPLAAEVPDRALGGFRGAGHTVQGTDGRLRER